MSSISTQQSRESGLVSIFMVLFFMIFMSVIVVGFVKIVNDDQAQATDNDLSTSALVSAQSGAEDGKRALLFCKSKANTAALQAACDSVFSSNACNALTSNSTLTSALNINVDTSGGRQDGIVSGNPAYQQRYTCLTIETETDAVEGLAVEKGTSELIPLTGTNDFTAVQFSWHATASSRDGTLAAFRSSTTLPAEDLWASGSDAYAAAMRLEFIAYPKSGINIDNLDQDTRTVLLLPGANGSPAVTSINVNDDIRENNPNDVTVTNTPKLARCQASTEYACTMNVRIEGVPRPQTHNYFLRVSAIYASAYIKVELRNGASVVQFDDVQPVIDVTGRANDVFRRVQTRVQYDSGMYIPQYALETSELCKDMVVTDRAASSSDACYP